MSAMLCKNLLMLLAVRISSYGCTWEVWRALKKPELLSAAPRATLTHLSCSRKFPRASITRYTHAKTAKHEKIPKFRWAFGGHPRPVIARVLDKNAVSWQTTKRRRQQKNFDSDSKETWSYNHVTFIPIAKTLMLYCRLIYMLSMLYVRFKIKEKVGMPESVKVG